MVLRVRAMVWLVAACVLYAVLGAAVYIVPPVVALALSPPPPLGYMPVMEAVEGRGGGPMFRDALVHGSLVGWYAGMSRGGGMLSMGPVLAWGAYLLSGGDMGLGRGAWAWHAGLAGDGSVSGATGWTPLARVGDVALTLAAPLCAVPLVAAAVGWWFRGQRPHDVPAAWLVAARRPLRTESAVLARWFARLLPVAAGVVAAHGLVAGMAVHPMSMARVDFLPDMVWITALAMAGGVAASLRDRFVHARRCFSGERAVCGCGYVVGLAAACPECGRAGGEGASYYCRRQRRWLVIGAAGAGAAGAALLISSLLAHRAAMSEDVRSGVALAPIERAHHAGGAGPRSYLRVPAAALIRVSAGEETFELALRSRFRLAGPMVHLDPDRHFATSATGSLEIQAPPRGGSDPGATSSRTPFAFSRYGPVNVVPAVRVGGLRITAGVELENLGCIGLMISDELGRRVRVTAEPLVEGEEGATGR